MFYSVASPGWRPGQPLTLAGALLFRTKAEAEAFAPGSPAVALAVRFDERWRRVRPLGASARSTVGAWSAPAVGNSLGGVTVFGSIPASLIRPSAEAEPTTEWHSRPAHRAAGRPGTEIGNWDSLTAALQA